MTDRAIARKDDLKPVAPTRADRRLVAAIKRYRSRLATLTRMRLIDGDNWSVRVDKRCRAAEKAEAIATEALAMAIIAPDHNDPDCVAPLMAYSEPQGVIFEDAIYLTYLPSESIYEPGQRMDGGSMKVMQVPMSRIRTVGVPEGGAR